MCWGLGRESMNVGTTPFSPQDPTGVGSCLGSASVQGRWSPAVWLQSRALTPSTRRPRMRKPQGRGDRQPLLTQDGTQTGHRGRGSHRRWTRETATHTWGLAVCRKPVRACARRTLPQTKAENRDALSDRQGNGGVEWGADPAPLAAKPQSTPRCLTCGPGGSRNLGPPVGGGGASWRHPGVAVPALWPLTPGDSRSGCPEPQGLPQAPACAPTVSPVPLNPRNGLRLLRLLLSLRALGSRCPRRGAARSCVTGLPGSRPSCPAAHAAAPPASHTCASDAVRQVDAGTGQAVPLPRRRQQRRGTSRGQGARSGGQVPLACGALPRTPHLGSGSPLLQGPASAATVRRPVPAARSSPP